MPETPSKTRVLSVVRLVHFVALGQIGLAGALLTAPAAAYTIQSTATTGCHERVTSEAWKRTRAALPEVTAPLPSRGEDEALMADVTFKVPDGLRDIGSVTLLLGVRDNDIKEHGPNDLRELSPAAADPKKQEEHCLRGPQQDEPLGSRQAVASCRAFIQRAFEAALDGLDAEGRVDPSVREKLKVTLAIRGEIDVEVPKFFLEAGRGVHALEDSFTHTFRNPDDPKRVRVVLNYIDYVEGTLKEERDGPAHAGELDDCSDPDELRKQRRLLATEASSAALSALLDPALNRAAKVRAITRVLDDYLVYDTSQHCSAENHWCDAPENRYGSPTLGCQLGALGGSSGAVWLPLALLLAWRLRRRRWGVVSLGLLGLTFAKPASANDKQGPIASPAAALAGKSDAAVPGKADKGGAFFLRGALGASYDNAAFSTGLGLHYQLTEKWMLGFDTEWNPYVALASKTVRKGSANAYFSVIRRYQLRRETVNIRTTASVGASMLLFDLVGADRYSVGPYLGLSFLGVEWKVARGCYLTLDPTYIALPIPSVTGIPFMYAQYRFLLGVELGG